MRGLWMLLLVMTVAVSGCSSNSNSGGTAGGGGTTTATTEMAGTWSVSGTGTCASGTSGCSTVSATFQVTLVTSTCSVNTMPGVFSGQGSLCYIANNNSGAGSITGALITSPSKNLGQGVLVGVPTDPVPDNSTVNLVFVSAAGGGKFTEFMGTATVVGGKMTGSGTCSAASTGKCTGASATFTATKL